MSLSLPIEVPGGPQAVATLKQVEAVGKNTAFQYNASWTMASAQVQNTFRQVEKVGVESQQKVAAASGASSRQYARAALQIAGTLQAITAAGDVSAGQLTRMISLASGVAFSFGPTGQVVGAIGLATVSIMNMFTRAREESEKLKAKLIEDLKAIRFETDKAVLMSTATATGLKIFAVDEKIATAREDLRKAELAGGESKAGQGAAGAALARLTALEAERKGYEDVNVAIGKAIVFLTQSEEAGRKAQKEIDDRAKALERLTAELQRHGAAVGASISAIARGARMPGGIGALDPAAQKAMEERAEWARGVAAGIRKEIDKAIEQAEEALASFRESMASSLSGSISNAIAQGFSVAIDTGSILKGIQGLGRAILGAFGQIVQRLGEEALATWLLTQKFMANLFTPVGLVASLALIALGAGLSAVAGSGSGGGGGYAGSGGAAVAQSTFTDRTSTTAIRGSGSGGSPVATPRPMQQFNITVIGTDDPKAQRDIKQLIRNADDRGL